MSLTLRTYKECQYWLYEPSRCTHWNNDTSFCGYFTYGGIVLTDAEGCHPEIKFPFCNLLGTHRECAGYEATGDYDYICILPDPSRHVLNSATNSKWVTSVSDVSYDDQGIPTPPSDWTFTAITGYNGGACDGAGTGTKATCTGYSPQKMGYSAIAPSSAEPTVDANSGLFHFDYKLPLDYTLLNIRANITKCYWWDGEPHQYTLDPATGGSEQVDSLDPNDPNVIAVKGDDDTYTYHKIIPLSLTTFDSKCTYAIESEVEPFRSGGTDEFQYKCNGCSTSCPHYTGACWKYCNDNKILPGYEVLAEQVLELRWMSRKSNWTKEVFERIFDDPYIWAWRGWGVDKGFTVNPLGGIDYDLPVDKVYISDYDNFIIDYEFLNITPGTESPSNGANYPDLIKKLSPLTSDPIIRNQFEVPPSDDDLPYYEFSILVEDPEVFIYGDAANYSGTYVINIEDPIFKAVLPEEVYLYDNTFDLMYELTTEKYNTFNTELNLAISDLLYNSPHEMRKNQTGAEYRSFIVNVNVNYGKNRILALNSNGTTWQFSTLDFNGFYVGGMVRQTSYSIKGDKNPVWFGPNYERGTGTITNDNGSINVVVDPIVHNNWKPEVSYVYNDFDYQKITEYQHWVADQGTEHVTGYVLYEKIIPTIDVVSSELVQLSSCHIVLTIDNDSLTSAVFAWLPDKIELIYNDAENEGAKSTCEFIIVEHNDTQMLAPNQVIIYPKDINDFRSFCFDSGDKLVLTNVSTFHKRSFDNYAPPPTTGNETVQAFSLYQDYGFVENPDISGQGYNYTLRKFDGTIHFGAVLKNRAGREFTSVKTNLLYWIKQPYCPEVEIKYEWAADYDLYSTSPTCYCNGEFSETLLTSDIQSTWFSMPPGVHVPYSEVREPYCGDHDKATLDRNDIRYGLGGNDKIGAMWYPYIQCDGWQSYTIITNQGYSAMEIMTDFVEDDGAGDYKHGQHDLRMLGPDQNLAWQGDFCVIPSACSCGRAHFNGRKKGDADYARFNGYAQYRSGASVVQLTAWYTDNVGIIMDDVRDNYFFPGFGNSSRPFLRSFRSNHRGQYYYKNRFGPKSDEVPGRLWKYMPAHADFSFADFSSKATKFFKDYSSHLGGPSVNTLGMVLFDNLEGSGYKEAIDTASTYSYNEVFRNHGGEDVDEILYPQSNDIYERTSLPWLDFQGDIQWAWRLPWTDIKRDSNNQGIFLGSLLLQYPPYKYNYTLAETRACPSEGTHTLSFIAPFLELDGTYSKYMGFKLDDGPVRYFDFFNGWSDTAALIGYTEVYKNINDNDDYYKDVSLVTNDEAYEVFANKEIIDGELTETTYYGYEGLAATLYADFFYTLPQEHAALISPERAGGAVASYSLSEVTFNEDENGASFYFDFSVSDVSTRRIHKFVYDCRFGVLRNQTFTLTVDDIEKEITLDTYYHIPGVTIYAPVEGGWVEIGSSSMRLAKADDFARVETITIDMNLPSEYLWYGGDNIIVVFRGTPTSDELYSSGYTESTYIGMNNNSNSYINYIALERFELWESWLKNGYETITTYERRFRVSRAGSPAEQPQGTGSERYLMAPGSEISTVYQRDDRVGMKTSQVIDKYDEWLPSTSLPDSDGTKLYRSKCRSRHVYDIILEQTPITTNTVSDVHKAETLVTDMYNNKALSDEATTISAHHFLLPDIETVMNERGLRFASNVNLNLSMENTVVEKLATLVPQATYCPAGHLYLPSPYFDTTCSRANRSFEYIYAQVEANEDVTLLHNMIYAGTIDPEEAESGDHYTTDAAVVGLSGHTARGFGEVYLAPESQTVPGYHKVPNEVSKYAVGNSLYQSRKEAATFIYYGVYSRIFSRFTKRGAFADVILTSLSMPPSMCLTPLLDFTGSEIHPDANTARTNFWLAGGVSWRSKHTGSTGYT